MEAQDVLTFWFEELTPKQWFAVSPELDRLITERFGALHAAAHACELYDWRTGPHGRLAEILVLDQFSRNIYRGKPGAFASDPLALALAQEAVAMRADRELPAAWKAFMYMPYMHSESLKIHDEAAKLFAQPGLEMNLDFEHKHRVILDRFGRYPHRNAVLGRASTPEEIEFLKQPGSSF